MQKKLLPNEDEEEVEEEVETWISHATVIKVCDSKFLLIVCKTPHKKSCSNQLQENDQRVVCKKAYHQKYYSKNREQIPAQQKRYRADNVEIRRTRRTRYGMKLTRKGAPAAREPIANKARAHQKLQKKMI